MGNQTGGLPLRFRLGLGVPMMCTVNQAHHLRLCNGSIGFIVHIQHDPLNRTELISSEGTLITKCSHMPEFVLAKLWKT
jgi:hypothetical protein